MHAARIARLCLDILGVCIGLAEDYMQGCGVNDSAYVD